jgi:hypothetical protein
MTYGDSRGSNKVVETLCDICSMNVIVIGIPELRVPKLNGPNKIVQFHQIDFELLKDPVASEEILDDVLEGMVVGLLMEFENVKVPVTDFLILGER